MEAHPFDDREFYESLGQLFYAVASIDKIVAQEEIAFLKTIIQDDWQSLSLIKPDKVLQILSEFDRLILEKADANDCFLKFKDFIESGKCLIPLSIKSLIWKTADGIAAAYAGKNKSEVILLTKLKSLLLDLPS